MNIYLVIEDGESFCIRAKTMAEAIRVCEESYCDDNSEDDLVGNIEYYHEEILQSCSLIGLLKN